MWLFVRLQEYRVRRVPFLEEAMGVQQEILQREDNAPEHERLAHGSELLGKALEQVGREGEGRAFHDRAARSPGHGRKIPGSSQEASAGRCYYPGNKEDHTGMWCGNRFVLL
jgi:uncharacterized membrane protein YccC